MTDSRRILFAGIGSPHGDDRAGWEVADELLRAVDRSPNVTVRKAAVPLDLLDWLEAVDCLHVCDAALRPESCGQLRRFAGSVSSDGRAVSQHAIPAIAKLRSQGSHDFGLPAVLELAARLKRLPPEVVVWAVDGARFEPGDPLSPALAEAIPSVAASIITELNDARNVSHAVTADAGSATV